VIVDAIYVTLYVRYQDTLYVRYQEDMVKIKFFNILNILF